MAVYEMYESRKTSFNRDSSSAILKFFQDGTSVEATARTNFAAAVPSTFLGMLLDNVSIDRAGWECWYCEAQYRSNITEVEDGLGDPGTPPVPPTPPSATTALGPEWSVDISAVTEKITQSKETIDSVAFGGFFIPNNNRAIGITADGTVEGCDRVSSHVEFSISRTFGFITLGYIDLLRSLVGKTNDDTWYGFPRGSVLFMGASLQSKDASKCSVSFKFAARPNETGIEIVPGEPTVDKKGWEYLWVMYKNVQDNNVLTQQPRGVYVERIYDEADYSLIGIGA